MNKLTQGRGTTSLYIDKLFLVVNDSEFGQVQNVEPFFVDVKYYYETGYFDDEVLVDEKDFIAISEATCSSTLWFKNNHGVKVQIMWGTNILNLLSESQYEELVSQLIRQSKGSIAEQQVDKYIATRDDVDAGVQRMLGMK